MTSTGSQQIGCPIASYVVDRHAGDVTFNEFVATRLPALLRRIQRHRRRRRAAWSVGAAVTAILVTASVLVGLRVPHQPAAHVWPLEAPAIVEVAKPDSFVTEAELTPGHLTAYLVTPDVSTTLYANAAGATPSDQLGKWRGRGKSVAVDGRPGFYVIGSEHLASPSGIFPSPFPSTAPVPTLAWQYAPNSWAFLDGCQMSSDPGRTCPDAEKSLVRAARLVKFASHPLITVPIQFGYLPTEWRLHDFSRLGAGGSGLFYGRPDSPYQIGLSFTNAGPNVPQVTITPADAKDWGDGWALFFQPTDAINGHAVYWNGIGPESTRTTAWVDYGTCHVDVNAANHDEVTRIVSGLTVANCLDGATWHDILTINAVV